MAAHQSPLLEAILFVFKEEICLRAPQTDNLWVTISIFLLGDELQYQTQGLYQSQSIPGNSHSYTHCICTSGCRMHRGLRLTDRTLAITFSTQLSNGLRWEERYLRVKTLRKWWEPWTPQVSIPFLLRQWGTGSSHWHQPACNKSKNCVFVCTKTQNFDKLIQKRDAWFNPPLNSFF